MVFRAKHAKTYKLRIRGPHGASVVHTTGMLRPSDAAAVESAVQGWLGRRGLALARPALIAMLTAKPPKIRLRDAYLAHLDGTLDAMLEAGLERMPSLDLHPLVTAWYRAKAKASKGAASAENYRRQLRLLYPESEPFPLALFTQQEVWRRLDALDRSAPTKNRIRAALSSFAKYLVKQGTLTTNFVRDIEGYGEHEPRAVYYQLADAKQLIRALPAPHAAIAAIAFGFAAEWGAIARLEVGDFDFAGDPVTLRVRGSKRAWRDRVVPLVPELGWLLPTIRQAVKGCLPTARPFAAMPEWRALRIQQEAARTLGLVAVNEDKQGPHRLHDWRHDHAVLLLRSGYSEQIAAAHLGHKNTELIRKVYGVFKPDRFDYAKKETSFKKRGVR